jgi:hypothetical protein
MTITTTKHPTAATSAAGTMTIVLLQPVKTFYKFTHAFTDGAVLLQPAAADARAACAGHSSLNKEVVRLRITLRCRPPLEAGHSVAQ